MERNTSFLQEWLDYVFELKKDGIVFCGDSIIPYIGSVRLIIPDYRLISSDFQRCEVSVLNADNLIDSLQKGVEINGKP